MKFLHLILLIILIQGYSAKKKSKSIPHNNRGHHGDPNTSKDTSKSSETSSERNDPFKNMMSFDSTAIASIKLELSSSLPNLTSNEFDDIISAMNIIYTLFSKLSTTTCSDISNIIYFNYISGQQVLDASVLSNITAEISSANIKVNKAQMNTILSAFQLLYNVASSLTLNAIINISTITANASGINLPPSPPPFQNMATFNTSVVGNIMQALAGSSNLTDSQKEYFISQLNTVYTVTLQLPANTLSSLNNAYLSAFVSGSTTIDSAILSNMESELSAALPNLTSIQLISARNAIKYVFELTSTLTILNAWNIYIVMDTAFGISLPPLPIISPKPFTNMSTFDSSSVASFKQEMLSEMPSLTQDQLDFAIDEINIIYSVATRLNSDSLLAIRDIVFNAVFSDKTYLDASTLAEISSEISLNIPDITSEQMNMIMFAGRLIYEFGITLSLDSIFDILVIFYDGSGIGIPASQPPFDNIASVDQVIITKVMDIIQTALPTYTQTQLGFIMYNLNILNTVSYQLPLNTISNITDLIYNASLEGVSELDSNTTSWIKSEIESVPTNMTQLQIDSIVESINGLYIVAYALPFNAFVNISMILINSSNIAPPPPSPPFQNMKTFSTSTAASINGEILTILPSLSIGLQDFIMSQMNIVYTVVAQIPINVLSTINNVLAGEYIYSSPFLDSMTKTNLSIETSTALPDIDQRQLNSFLTAVNFLYVIGSSFPVETITNIYMYAGAEANISLPVPQSPPVFKNMTDFSPPVIASILDIMVRALRVELGNPDITAAQLQPFIDAINIVYNVVQRISFNGSTTIQNLMFNLYISGTFGIDSSTAEIIQNELQSSIPNIVNYQIQYSLYAFSMLLYIASSLPINAVLKIAMITSDASGIILPSPMPLFVFPIPDDEAVHNITTIITVVHPEITLPQKNNITYAMDLIYTVAKMLPTDVVLNISGIAYNGYISNGLTANISITEAMQNVNEFNLETQLNIQSVLLPQVPNFTISQINHVMSAINLLHSVAQTLTVDAVQNISSIAYNIMGF